MSIQRPVTTAGGIIWRRRDGQLQVLLIHRPRYDDWSWPKGKLTTGESIQETAIRELGEETEQDIVLGRPLPGQKYLTPKGQDKHVHFWASRRAHKRHNPSALAARAPFDSRDHDEVDKMEWLPAADAAQRLTHASSRDPLQALMVAEAEGTLETRALLIVRHGRAVPRRSWYGAESDRPLTPFGHGQGAALVPLLSAYGIEQVMSSRWERCAATIAPYVRATNVHPLYSEYLTEAQYERSPQRVAATIRELVERATESSVICTHRPVLPTVLNVLGTYMPDAVANKLPSHDPFLEPGEALVAHVAHTPTGPQVVATETVSPQVW